MNRSELVLCAALIAMVAPLIPGPASGQPTTAPLLTVVGDLIDPIITATTTTPPVAINVASGTPVSFCWSADASAYGGIVTGYRYGWDVLDPNDDNDPGWASSFVPFTQQSECSNQQSFTVGTHTFTVEVIDSDAHKSRAVVVMTIEPPLPTQVRSWGFLKCSYR